MGALRRWRLRRSLISGVRALQLLSVGDVMTEYVMTISPERSVIDAASIMIGESVSALVVERKGKPIGILTERDFISKVPAAKQALGLAVKDIMSCSFGVAREKTCAVESVTPQASLFEARNLLRQKGIRKLVITNSEGLVAGIVTQTDLSKALYGTMACVARFSDGPFLVKDVMTASVASAPRDATFAKAKEVMKRRNVSALPIVEKGAYVGVVTEYDVVAQFYDAGGKLDVKRIEEIMKSPVKAIPVDLNIFDANTVMLFEKVRRLLVVNQGKVVGIVTQTDLVHACYAYAERLFAAVKEGTRFQERDLVQLKRSNAIISEYAGEHLRSYTVR